MTLTTEATNDIRLRVESRRQEIIDRLIDFCSIAAENPPGGRLVESQEWIAATLADYSIPFDVHHSSRTDTEHRIIIGKVGDRGPTMYLHGHYDVVPAFDAAQFNPALRDGSIYGRGTSDMKGGLVSMLVAAVIHRDLGGDGRVRLVYVPDEESGGTDGAERLSEMGLIDPAKSVGAIVGEPSHPDIWYASRGAFTVNVTVSGVPAHVGLHYNGINAFEQAHSVIGELIAFRNAVAERKTSFRIEPEAARSSIVLIGGVSGGGTNFNIVPDTFSFTIDRRPNPDEDFAEVQTELLEVLAELGSRYRLSVEVLQSVESASTPINHPLITSLERSITLVNGRHAPLSMCPGCLETRIYSRVGIPTVAYGPGPMTEMHAPNEHVPVDNLVESTAVYAAVLGDSLGYKTRA